MPILSASADRSKQVIGLYHPKTWKEKGLPWTIGLFIATYIIVVIALGIYWSIAPATFDVAQNAKETAAATKNRMVPGFTTTATLVRVADTMLHKPGGYLSNDVTPPGIYLDNMPEWEFGVLVQVRDMAQTFRNDFSRSQSQSVEDKDLIIAQPRFNFDSNSWMLPSTEGEYEAGIKALQSYMNRLGGTQQPAAQFYVRADNLRDWLSQVDKRLGSLSQRLGASVGQEVINVGQPPLATGASNGENQTVPASEVNKDTNDDRANSTVQQFHKTSWTEIDNIFFEARGQAWALLHLLKAIQIDFAPVLADKNAQTSLQQVIRELEPTQSNIWSPVLLNGSGFGLVTNHSLIMASYLSRANAAVIDLRRLLEQG